MKNSLTKALTGAVAAGVTILGVSLGSWSMDHAATPLHDPTRMVAHMSVQLDLTGSQQDAVNELLVTSRAGNESDRQRLQVLREEMRGLRDNFDDGGARKIADEIGEITSRLVFQAASTHAAVYQLLTDEQKLKLDSIGKKRRARREKWHDTDMLFRD